MKERDILPDLFEKFDIAKKLESILEVDLMDDEGDFLRLITRDKENGRQR